MKSSFLYFVSFRDRPLARHLALVLSHTNRFLCSIYRLYCSGAARWRAGWASVCGLLGLGEGYGVGIGDVVGVVQQVGGAMYLFCDLVQVGDR